MSFFGEIKKLLFGVKAVGKSQGEKAIDYGKEAGGEILDKTGDIFGKAKDTATDFGSSAFDQIKDSATDYGSTMLDKSEDLLGKAKDIGGDMLGKAGDALSGAKDVAGNAYDSLAESEFVQSAGSTAENIGGKILDKRSDLANKAGSVAEDVGGKLMDTGNELLGKGAELSENVGGKVMDAADAALERANEIGNDLLEKGDALSQKADAEAAKYNLDNNIDEASSLSDRLEAHVKGQDVMNQKDPKIGYDNLKGDLLDGKDDFFSKASKYADGNYSGKETPSIDTPDADAAANDIFANTAERQKELEEAIEKEPFKGDVKGYTDLDGDGDPVIDDAILDEDPDVPEE